MSDEAADGYDLAGAGSPHGIAVLLHPHPRFGGDRFHPIVAALFERLPPAGIAALVDDPRVAGWHLVVPQVALLSRATIGGDPRPKAVTVPEHDQLSSPDAVRQVVAGWTATTTTTIVGADHFLSGSMRSVVDGVVTWATEQLAG